MGLLFVAGRGDLPHMVLAKLIRIEVKLSIVAFEEFSHSKLKRFKQVQWIATQTIPQFLTRELPHLGASRVLFAGKFLRTDFTALINHTAIFSALFSDLDTSTDLQVVDTMSAFLEGLGIRVQPINDYLDFPNAGVLTTRKLSFDEEQSVIYGLKLAKQISNDHIGQCVALKGHRVFAVEAIEGTDAMIRRAGRSKVDGLVIAKAGNAGANPFSEMPVVGPGTIQCISRNGGAVLAIEEGKVGVSDVKALVNMANQRSVSFAVRKIPG